MTEKQQETYDNLLKVPGIHKSSYPNYEDHVYLKVIGRGATASIKVHKSGDFSFVIQARGKYRYIKNVDGFMEKLFPQTVVGLAFHLDRLYIKK